MPNLTQLVSFIADMLDNLEPLVSLQALQEVSLNWCTNWAPLPATYLGPLTQLTTIRRLCLSGISKAVKLQHLARLPNLWYLKLMWMPLHFSMADTWLSQLDTLEVVAGRWGVDEDTKHTIALLVGPPGTPQERSPFDVLLSWHKAS